MRILLLLVFLSLNFSLFSQEIPREHRKANTMAIDMELGDKDILDLIAKNLINLDYQIEEIDKDFSLLSTKPRLIKNILNTYIKIKVSEGRAEFQNYTSMEWK